VATQDALTRLRATIARVNAGFTAGQKAVVAVGIALVVAIAIAIASLTSAPSYGVLFSGLSAQDAGAITAKLQASGVPYQLANGGTTILVPQGEVDQERVALAEAGLPSQTVGLTSLNGLSITSSQITQQADYQAALQAQLAQTIEAINGVQSAQVNLALPPTDAFALGQSQQPSASVIVTLDPGVSLTPTQVEAIVHLVASAIPGMSANQVTVADQNGDVLAAPGLGINAQGGTQSEQSFDAQLEASLQSMLDGIVGPGNANVRVAATLNTSQVTTRSQTIQTQGGRPVTTPTQTQTQTQTFTGNGTIPGGTLGQAGIAAAGNQVSNYRQTSTSTQYAIGQVTQTVQQAPGSISRLSVAVAVNSKVRGVSLAKIRQVVAAAAGILPARGDTLSVVAVPFQAVPAASAGATNSLFGSIFGLAKVVLLVLGALAAILLMSRASARTEIEPLFPDELEPALAGGAGQLGAPTEELPAVALPQSHPILGEDVLDYIDRQPEDVAKLLRVWVNARGRR
jgi:flagellar M-ring protein FliF